MRYFKYVLLISFAYCMVSARASAQNEVKKVDNTITGSYIVTFHATNQAKLSPILPGKRAGQKVDHLRAPFGQHSTGQSRIVLAKELGIRGQVLAIFDMINAAHLQIEPDEAEKLKNDARVLRVTQSRTMTPSQSVQINPGWALDRLDQSTTILDNKYIYNATGAGRLIYILDSGLALANAAVQAEFGSRASVFWDVNNLGGHDCIDHGTKVASVAAGNNYGVAKGAIVRAVKMTVGCGFTANDATFILAFNWLALYAAPGTIVSMSFNYEKGFSCPTTLNDPAYTNQDLDNSIKAAHDAGVIVVAAAGNDGCDTAYFSPSRIPHAFVVGATTSTWFNEGKDGLWDSSRIGANISAFAPGHSVPTLSSFGLPSFDYGTSLSAPLMAGMFAVGCSVAGTLCSVEKVPVIYETMRSIGVLGTVVMPDGSTLPTGTTSRFINRAPW